ncbi:hypothetical protein Pcinc_021121 [Petrolisthes cinctipes]|uniref:Uncharacterized protein n=1 Tax=Petrolisthes cinctipes TaxID=88211 RepID=A0AAE1FI24_PETCI|nr:hypothetical protein Pcinc_021121 [Petrolisthes cinctipes]
MFPHLLAASVATRRPGTPHFHTVPTTMSEFTDNDDVLLACGCGGADTTLPARQVAEEVVLAGGGVAGFMGHGLTRSLSIPNTGGIG